MKKIITLIAIVVFLGSCTKDENKMVNASFKQKTSTCCSYSTNCINRTYNFGKDATLKEIEHINDSLNYVHQNGQCSETSNCTYVINAGL
jgi:hypothetical protein